MTATTKQSIDICSLLIFAITGAMALPALAAAPVAPAVLTGNWAGDSFSLRNNAGGAMVQGKCAVGRISAPIIVDAKGRFAASGYFNPETSGYRLTDIAPRDRPAQFIGEVKGNKLELVVKSPVVAGSKTYRLQRDKIVKFANCSEAERAGLK